MSLPPNDATPRIVFFAEVQFQKDNALYHHFFPEAFLYLYRNQTLYDDWSGVIIFPDRSLEPDNTLPPDPKKQGPRASLWFCSSHSAISQPGIPKIPGF